MAWQAGLRQGRPDVVYFSEYDLACSQIGAAERLSKIRTSGLADQLRRAAVERTIGAHWMSIDELVPALHGRGHIELLDDEWLPASAFLTRSSDRDLDPFLQSVAMGDLADVLARLKHNTVHVGQDSWSVLLSCYKCVVSYCERHLPHWQPEGAALFLTWRWHGSLPKTVEILEHRSPGKAFVAMDRKLDGAATGTRWLHYERVDERVAQVVADALRYGERQLGLYQLRAWGQSRSHFDLSGRPPVEDRQSGQESFGAPGQCHPRAHRLAVLARRIVRSLGTEQRGRLAVVERVWHGRRTFQEACPT